MAETESDQSRSGVEREQPTISRRVVRQPEGGNPGTAGLGIAYDSGAREGERFRIEQLWPDGTAEGIYVHEDDVLELVRAITKHYEWEVA